MLMIHFFVVPAFQASQCTDRTTLHMFGARLKMLYRPSCIHLDHPEQLALYQLDILTSCHPPAGVHHCHHALKRIDSYIWCDLISH